MNIVEIGNNKTNYSKVFSYRKNVYYESTIPKIDKTILQSWTKNNKEKLFYPVINSLEDGILKLGEVNLAKDFNKNIKIPSRTSPNIDTFENIGVSILNQDLQLDVNRYKDRGKVGVEKILDDFLVDSPNHRKIEISRNLYTFYKREMSLDSYKELNWGFRNYNCLNFYTTSGNQIAIENLKPFLESSDPNVVDLVTQQLANFDDFKNIVNSKTHRNCVVYSNPLDVNNENLYAFNSNSLSICFYINANKNAAEGNLYNPGCILYIPELISLYLVKNSDGSDGFRLVICLDSAATNSNFTEISSLDFSNGASQKSGNVYITKNDSLRFNHWERISLVISSSLLKIHTNLGEEIFEKQASTNPSAQNSFISIGNLPLGDTVELHKLFFSTGKDVAGDNLGPYITKSINYKNFGILPVKQKSSISQNNLFLDQIQTTTFDFENASKAFIGEIHDFKIINDVISNTLVEQLAKSSYIEGLDTLFYLPMCYVPEALSKRTILNTKGDVENSGIFYDVSYSSIINPYLHSYTSLVDVSTESFLVESNFKNIPNVIINSNVYSDFDNSIFELSNNNDLDYFSRNGINLNFYIQQLITDVNHDEMSSDNLAYFDKWRRLSSYLEKQNMIYPCDNGLQSQYFDNVLKDYESSLYHNDILGRKDNTLVSLENIYLHNENNIVNDLFSITNPSPASLRPGEEKYFRLSNKNFTKLSRLDEGNIDIDFVLDNGSLNIDQNTLGGLANCVTRVLNSDVISSQNRLIPRDTKTIDNTTNFVYYDWNLTYPQLNKSKRSPTTNIFAMSKHLFDCCLKHESLKIFDKIKSASGGANDISISDTEGLLYRSDCLTKHATWNYVGHSFYYEGMLILHHPSLFDFGHKDLEIRYESKSKVYVSEFNVDLEKGLFNKSFNSSYIENLRIDDNPFNKDEDFVYITDVDLHDKYLNVVAKAKLAQPIPKKSTDAIRIKLKMDY